MRKTKRSARSDPGNRFKAALNKPPFALILTAEDLFSVALPNSLSRRFFLPMVRKQFCC
jgi:hypothetical protein